MTKFTILFACAQVLLIQNVFSACLQAAAPAINIGNLGLGSYSGPNCGASLNNAIYNNGALSYANFNGLNSAALNAGALSGLVANNAGYGSYSNTGYGGSGTGEISALGELGVAGNSNVYGHLPVTGLVQFNGNLPAGGLVTVLGNTPNICGCPCGIY